MESPANLEGNESAIANEYVANPRGSRGTGSQPPDKEINLIELSENIENHRYETIIDNDSLYDTIQETEDSQPDISDITGITDITDITDKKTHRVSFVLGSSGGGLCK